MNPIDAATPAGPDREPGADAGDFLRVLRRLLVCNPFYLASAALLLFGLGRLTRDPHLLTTETRQVLFQFTALQCYGCLVVGTALWLAARRIWYDSALLVVLENGLLLAPFLGISQAVLLDEPLAVWLVASGALAVVGRALSVRRWYPDFHLPDRVRWAGLLVLLVNAGLPLVYRTRVDTDWHLGNRILWLGVLPLLALLANAARPAVATGPTAAGRPWLPLLVQGLWLAGTGVHAWSVAWVDKTPMPWALAVPTLLACLWTLLWRIRDLGLGECPGLRVPAVAAIGIPGWLAYPDVAVTAGVMVANGILLGLHSTARLERHAAVRWVARFGAGLAAVRLLVLLPTGWMPQWLGPDPLRAVGWGALGLLLLGVALRFRHPWGTLLGMAVVDGAAARFITAEQPHVSLQAAMVFGLLHSLSWTGVRDGWRIAGQLVLVLGWTADGVAWGWDPSRGTAWIPAVAGAVLAGTGWVVRRRWPAVVPAWLVWAAAANAMTTPGNWVVRTTPDGFLVMGLSLVLFGVGTALALRRRVFEAALERAMAVRVPPGR